MKLRRIFAISLRYLYLFKHNPDKWVDLFYWPAVDLVLWGITTLFIKSLEPGFATVTLMIVSGLIFWQVTWRGQIEITIHILEELWNKNLINIFVAPLKFSEWIASFFILGAINLVVGFSFVTLASWWLYKVNIFVFGIYLIPFIILLFMSGWWIGLLVGALILRFGSRSQGLAWSFPWAISPFSAIFYPLSILPEWVQQVSAFFPTSYVFEGVREVIDTGHLDITKIYYSLALNIIYLVAAVFLLRMSFKGILKKGLVKVY